MVERGSKARKKLLGKSKQRRSNGLSGGMEWERVGKAREKL